MLGEPTRDRRAERRAATKAEILDAAWAQVRADGLAALSLRDLAKTVGMQPPSLYGYFASKHAIYDAMFAQGAQAFLDERPADLPDDPRAAQVVSVRYFMSFCVADPARYQLLFQRTIPGFEPSPESYAISVAGLEALAERLAGFGLRDPDLLDLYTALVTGLTDQQISNDPGGDRWIRRIDDAVEMFWDFVEKQDRGVRRAGTKAAATAGRNGKGKGKGKGTR
jgi:AcrR family transcriptional regulator